MSKGVTERLKRFFQSFKNPNERVRINFGGKIYIAFTLLIGFAAVNTGNNMLYILLSFLLALMGVSGFLSRYNLKGFKVIFYQPDEIWCCKPERLKIEVKNTKQFPSFLVELYQKNVGLKVLLKLVEKKREVVTDLVFNKRGIYLIKEIELKSTFPFGLFERTVRFPVEGKLLVFPQPKEPPFHTVPKAVKEKAETLTGQMQQRGGTTVASLKEFQGESFSLVSWKYFAKYGELYVKELEEPQQAPQVIIDMNLLPGSKEDKISYAAYLVRYYRQKQYAVGVKCLDNKEIPPSAGREHYKKILECLALI